MVPGVWHTATKVWPGEAPFSAACTSWAFVGARAAAVAAVLVGDVFGDGRVRLVADQPFGQGGYRRRLAGLTGLARLLALVGQADRLRGFERGDLGAGELPVPDPETIEHADRRGLDTVGPAAEILDPAVVPAVGVGGNRRRRKLRAVEIEARSLRPQREIDPMRRADLQVGAGDAVRALEEAQNAVLARVPGAQPAVGEHLDARSRRPALPCRRPAGCACPRRIRAGSRS